MSGFGQGRGLALLTYLSIGWLLVNWWPHDNLQRVVGNDFPRLIWIEYGFHMTLIPAGACAAYRLADRESASLEAVAPSARKKRSELLLAVPRLK